MIGSGRYADMTEKLGNEIYLSSVLTGKKALLGTDITKPLLHQATKKASGSRWGLFIIPETNPYFNK